MPIVPPSLDDRSYDDLVREVLARIPAHAPEYAHPVAGDPGRTLVELFAWLTDTMLYRANLIPERQRLVFLSLLGLPLRPAKAATGLVSILPGQPTTSPFLLADASLVTGAETFETRSALLVLPMEGKVYIKRPVTPGTEGVSQDLVDELAELYGLEGKSPKPYASEPRFVGQSEQLDLVADTLDRSLWFAMLAPDAASVAGIRTAIENGLTVEGREIPLEFSVGLVPSEQVPDTFSAEFLRTIGERRGSTLSWELSVRNESSGGVVMQRLVPSTDSTYGLATSGTVKLPIPRGVVLDAATNDVRVSVNAGVGDVAPRIDDAKVAARLVCWVRMRLSDDSTQLGLDWAATNVVPVEHRRTVKSRVFGVSDGTADQIASLSATQVDTTSLVVEVEEEGVGYRTWNMTDAIEAADRDDSVFMVDAEAGLVRFGDGLRGRIPVRGARFKASFRYGGGSVGNLLASSLTAASGTTSPTFGGKLAVVQAVATAGGVDAETVADAERRIPAHLTHRDRAVTEDDFKALAGSTPGVKIGRVEVMPGFKPHTRDQNIPGVISVMVLPEQEEVAAPNPRPDRRLIETVYAWLDERRLIGTELYVIGCQYLPMGLAVRVEVRQGYDRDETLQAVSEAVRNFLWPLPPGGPYESADGWPLKRPIRDREIEVVVARVPGVDEVVGVRLFRVENGQWRVVPQARLGVAEIRLQPWELPELLGLDVGTTERLPDTLDSVVSSDDDTPTVGVPVVPEVC